MTLRILNPVGGGVLIPSAPGYDNVVLIKEKDAILTVDEYRYATFVIVGNGRLSTYGSGDVGGAGGGSGRDLVVERLIYPGTTIDIKLGTEGINTTVQIIGIDPAKYEAKPGGHPAGASNGGSSGGYGTGGRGADAKAVGVQTAGDGYYALTKPALSKFVVAGKGGTGGRKHVSGNPGTGFGAGYGGYTGWEGGGGGGGGGLLLNGQSPASQYLRPNSAVLIIW